MMSKSFKAHYNLRSGNRLRAILTLFKSTDWMSNVFNESSSVDLVILIIETSGSIN
jgi:hypothetical protein